jgi:epoxyqueuosine reductase
MIANRPWHPSVEQEIRELFAGEDLVVLGVCDVEHLDDSERERAESEYRDWISRGFHGTMAFLERNRPLAYRAESLLPHTRSIIVTALNYYVSRPAAAPPDQGIVARYARGRDYHKELGRRLRRISRALDDRYPDDRFRPFTDATPLAERWFAERAGIGFPGRNTLLINSELGSWFCIGEILSTRRFSPSESSVGRHGACPSSCRRCIDICPTGALYDSHRIDASRCISYLTIEHDGPIPVELRPKIGTWIFGCDLCQEVCPLNVRARVTDVARFLAPIAGDSIPLREILQIRTQSEYTRRFAGSPLMRAGRRRLVRNALIAVANAGMTGARDTVDALRSDPDDLVAEQAEWTSRRLHV